MFSLMLSLYLHLCLFTSGCGLLKWSFFYEFLAHNPFYQLRYGTAKTAKEVLTTLEKAAVIMMWAVEEYW
jgi:hypothetical protein